MPDRLSCRQVKEPLQKGFAPLPSLKKRAGFLQVQGQGKRFRGKHLLIMVAAHDGTSRVGYTVSRRVGNAVVRNRLRRRLKEIVRQSPQGLRANTDYVVIAFPTAAQQSYTALRGELLCLLKRIGAPTWGRRFSPPVCSQVSPFTE